MLRRTQMPLYVMMGVLLDLLQNEKTTAAKLADKYEVSERSIYRYITSLSSYGVPIYTTPGRYGGITLSAPLEINKLYFSKTELDTLKQLIKKERATPESATLMQKLKYLENYKN